MFTLLDPQPSPSHLDLTVMTGGHDLDLTFATPTIAAAVWKQSTIQQYAVSFPLPFSPIPNLPAVSHKTGTKHCQLHRQVSR
jgi:hypothetical protein